MTPLAYKLIGTQFDAIAKVWGTWITPEAHGAMKRDGDIILDLTSRWPGDIAYRFTVPVGHGHNIARVSFIAKYKSGEFIGHDIESTGVKCETLNTHIVALGKLTTLMYRHLVQHATDKGFLPENIMP